jgi:hypothetical protein
MSAVHLRVTAAQKASSRSPQIRWYSSRALDSARKAYQTATLRESLNCGLRLASMMPSRPLSASSPASASTASVTSAYSSDTSRKVAMSKASLLPKWKLIDAAVWPAAPAIFADVSAESPCSAMELMVALIRSSRDPVGRTSRPVSGFADMAFASEACD